MLNKNTKELLRAASGPPTDLTKFGESLGVVELQWKELKVDGMVLPKGSGYKVILNTNKGVRSRSHGHTNWDISSSSQAL